MVQFYGTGSGHPKVINYLVILLPFLSLSQEQKSEDSANNFLFLFCFRSTGRVASFVNQLP